MSSPSPETYVLPRWMRSWEQFWFTPADPSVLALMRIACGMVVVYTLFVYSFQLQETMGEHAWHDLLLRMDIVHDRPVRVAPLSGSESAPLSPPADEFQKQYLFAYRQKWGQAPPPPYPRNFEEVHYLEMFRATYGVDLRALGLQLPSTESEKEYLQKYMAISTELKKLGDESPYLPPPAYPKNEKEAQQIDEYRVREGIDPRLLYDRGMHIFSLWFHVTDPTVMAIVHGLIVFVAVLFTVGFCTRITSALTWFGSLSYIHRNPTMLFGVDTMMTIMLLYLMIGPSGAVFSVDQWLRRWWKGEQASPAPPEPSISANIAIRLLQVHLGIIYLVAGLAKLQGPSWWNGTAVWGTIANYEFAPMQYDFYLALLRYLGDHQLLLSVVLTGGGLFTLVFEIAYLFLIWRPRLRWVFLGSAIVLHGFIGMFMGLRTFALLMLVMNMSFLRKEEVYWMVSWFRGSARAAEAPGAPQLAGTEITATS